MDFLNTLTIFIYALLGGFVPGLFWMWFWLHEKHKHKEPRRVIIKVFICGMAAVLVSYLCQKGVDAYLHVRTGTPMDVDLETVIGGQYLMTLIHVIIEEFAKFAAAYVIAFRTKVFNEPIDAFIYLMTAAVGFAAMENTLFLIQPLFNGQTLETVVTGHMRFIGASVLHVASSGILSVFIGLSFCKGRLLREVNVWLGLSVAILIHWTFNILLVVSDPSYTFLVFSSIWVATIFLILALERVKQIKCF